MEKENHFISSDLILDFMKYMETLLAVPNEEEYIDDLDALQLALLESQEDLERSKETSAGSSKLSPSMISTPVEINNSDNEVQSQQELPPPEDDSDSDSDSSSSPPPPGSDENEQTALPNSSSSSSTSEEIPPPPPSPSGASPPPPPPDAT